MAREYVERNSIIHDSGKRSLNVAVRMSSAVEGGGIYRTLRWEEITAAREEGMAGLRYLVVGDASGSREVHVPLFLRNMPAFVSAVRSRAGDGHPWRKR